MIKPEWIDKGYVDEPVPADIDLKQEIRRMCAEKNAIIMAHYYTRDSVQEIADFIGDSLALARKAATTDADIIVMCGVHFMAETCKILCPDKTVICPDLRAGCSLADSCSAEDLRKFKEEHPGYTVVSYVNTTAAVKALTDVVVTSGNARKIIEALPEDEKIIFGPDQNLGGYINSVTGRDMLLWPGGCHVHGRFSVKALVEMRKEHPDAVVLAHPECKSNILALADVIGSTAVLLEHVKKSDKREFIVVTESGILFEMRRACPDKTFLPVPPEMAESAETHTCHCNECEYMRMNTLERIYNSLKHGWPTIEVRSDIAHDALKPIERMLSMS